MTMLHRGFLFAFSIFDTPVNTCKMRFRRAMGRVKLMVASSAKRIAASAVAAFLLAAPPALAQQSPVAEVAAYQGPDRQQRLVEGAKKEKELTFYSSIPPQDI